jgi:hypothetical protein
MQQEKEITWRLDFGMNHNERMSLILNQEKVNILALKYFNVNNMKYYYGQIEVTTTEGNCEEIANDLYKTYQCPIKISIEDEYGIDKIGSISYVPSFRKYESDYSESSEASDTDASEDDVERYKYTDKVYNNWKLTRPHIESEREKVKKIIKILQGYIVFTDSEASDSDDDNVYDYQRVDEEYANWIHTRPGDDFESEEGKRILRILEKN